MSIVAFIISLHSSLSCTIILPSLLHRHSFFIQPSFPSVHPSIPYVAFLSTAHLIYLYFANLFCIYFQLAEVFEAEIDPVMQQLGYCCGRKYTFNPQVLCCYGKQLCTIPRDAKYFSYQNRFVRNAVKF